MKKYIISTKYDGANRKCYPKLCDCCNKYFYIPKHRHTTTKFCSKTCRDNFKKSKRIEVKCAWCNATLFFSSSKLKYTKSGLKFCNRECKELAQRIGGIQAIHPSHYGKTDNNYRRLAFDNLPNVCNRCGWNKDKRVLQVHHVDSNRKNNSIENLEILCPNCHWEITLATISKKRKDS